MPANRHASAYLNGAYQRMLAAIQEMEPPSFDLCPTAEQFEEAAAHVRGRWVSAIDDYLHALAHEASCNSRSHINTTDRQSLLSDALHDDALAAELEREAYDLSKETECSSDREQHSTHYYALSGAR